ncbi:MFS transporter [Desertibacillus haloalkaliphilus]|uniref:MFS transporter n=1 Tax=Desertibacillus haloalkaliphilus TaxID=1328930 RepID=UPI001C263643|nr:nitrate/nitrite transporter [Desertibacillus haloalkaliphilus]MBU8907800.1 NarK/NasA family nitrate transporter [Desertibacillus haloalkaliphilus]
MKGSSSALLLSTLAMVVSFSVWTVMSPIASQLQEAYGFGSVERSILVAIPVLLGSIMRIPMGILTDRYGGKKVYTITMLSLVFPLVAAGFADSYAWLLMSAFFIGMAGTTFAIAITYVSKWYPPEKQGLVLGIAGMGNFGTAAVSFTIPTIVLVFGLSWAFWGLAILIGLMAIIFWFGTKESEVQEQPSSIKDSLSVMKMKATWVLSLFYFLTFGGFVAFSVYMPTLLQDEFLFSAVGAGMISALFITIATFIRPLGGYLADKFGTDNILSTVFVGAIGAALIISFLINDLTFFVASCFLLAFLFGIGNGAVFKLVPEVSKGNTGAVTGVVGAIGGLGGFFPPIMLGFINQYTGSYVLGFVFLGAFGFVCLLVHYKFMKQRKHRQALSSGKTQTA